MRLFAFQKRNTSANRGQDRNSIANNRTGRSGGRKNFNVNFIVNTNIFLYNYDVF